MCDVECCWICLEDLSKFEADSVRLTCCGQSLCRECAKRLMDDPTHRGKCGCCRGEAATTHKELYLRSMKHAKRGKAWAMWNIANFCLDGQGAPQSDIMGRLWLEKASSLGHYSAMFQLSRIIFESEPERGLELLKNAAVGSRGAARLLSMMDDKDFGLDALNLWLKCPEPPSRTV